MPYAAVNSPEDEMKQSKEKAKDPRGDFRETQDLSQKDLSEWMQKTSFSLKRCVSHQ